MPASPVMRAAMDRTGPYTSTGVRSEAGKTAQPALDVPVSPQDGRDGSRLGPVVVPSTAKDWEQWKGIIGDMYMQQHLGLKEVIEIMNNEHNFRATPRMYKRQFAKWRWQKYRKGGEEPVQMAKRKARKATGRRFDTSCESASSASEHSGSNHGASPPELNGAPSPDHIKQEQMQAQPAMVKLHLAHENSTTYHVAAALHDTKLFMYRTSQMDPEWKAAGRFRVMNGYDTGPYMNFSTALQHFSRGEENDGGRMLRYAFRGLETVLRRDHFENNLDFIIGIPHLLLGAGRTDILLIYLRYLIQLLALKRSPLMGIVKHMLELAHPRAPQADDNASELTTHLVDALEDLASESVVRLRGNKDRISLTFQRDRIMAGVAEATEEDVRQLADDFEALALDAAAEYGESHDTAMQMENSSLEIRWRYQFAPDKVIARTRNVLERLLSRLTIPELMAGKWPGRDRFMYIQSCLRLSEYYESIGDSAEAARLRENAVLGPQGGGLWLGAMHRIESWLRRQGRDEEADSFQARRLQTQVPQQVVEELEKEEHQKEQQAKQHSEDEDEEQQENG